MKAEYSLARAQPAPAGAVKSPSQLLFNLILLLCAISLAIPLLGYAYAGTFTRYVADDFCAGRNLALRGFWGSQIWTYDNHSGRFFSYFIRIGLAFVGKGHETGFVPGLLLIGWLAATTWTFLQYGELLGWRKHWLSAFVLTELLIFAMLRTGPDPGQSFYWQAGNITYTLPLILITIYLGLLPYYEKTRHAIPSSLFVLIVAGLLTFSAAGTSETNAVFQCAGTFVAILACHLRLIPKVRRLMPVLYSGFAGSVLATVVVVIAPGNAVREAGVRISSPPLAKSAVVVESAVATVHYVADFLRTRPLAALALFAIPLVLTWFLRPQVCPRPAWQSTIGLVAGIWVFALSLIFSAIFPGMYALASLPPQRALFVDHWVLTLALLVTGILVGALTNHWYERLPALGLLAGVAAVALILPWTVKSARENFTEIAELRRYASEWDAQDTQLRSMNSRGELQVSLPWNASVASGGTVDHIEWISEDPAYWINACTADYYGIKSLRVLRADNGGSSGQAPVVAGP